MEGPLLCIQCISKVLNIPKEDREKRDKEGKAFESWIMNTRKACIDLTAGLNCR